MQPDLRKNELKRPQKSTRQAIEAAEKATRQATVASSSCARARPSAVDDAVAFTLSDSIETLYPSHYIASRKAVVQSLKDASVDPFPHQVAVTTRIPQYLAVRDEKLSAVTSGDNMT